MQPILIKKSETDLKHQYAYIKERDQSLSFQTHKRPVIIFLCLSLGYLALMFLTAADHWISLKGITSLWMVLFWLVSLVCLLWWLISIWNRNKRFSRIIANALKEKQDYCLSFDEEKMTIHGPDFKHEFRWSYFKSYLESSSAIFIFHDNTLEFYAFGPEEIGAQNLLELKRIVKEKLIHMDVYDTDTADGKSGQAAIPGHPPAAV